MTMFPSVCMWAYRTPLTDALREVEQTAFHYIDIYPDMLDAPEALQAKKDLGLNVSCAMLDGNLPRGMSLDGNGQAATGEAMNCMKQALQKLQSLGASTAYLNPCASRKHLGSFGEALRVLAEDAAGKGIRLCVAHARGSALPTAKDALDFVRRIDHPNLFLLLNVGHTLLSKEKPWEVAAAAGKSVGYVQMNDNDGKHDRRWPLRDGLLTYADIERFLEALQGAGYTGTLGLDLSFDRASLVSGLSRSRNLLIRIQDGMGHKSLLEPETRRKN